MTENPVSAAVTPAAARQIDQACDRFEAAWKVGRRPDPAAALDGFREPTRSALLRQILLLDWEYRRRSGDEPGPADYHTRFPADRSVVDAVGCEMAEAGVSTHVGASGPVTPWSGDGADGPPIEAEDCGPDRYELCDEVGRGGIGVVFRGRDRLLGREVAVKVLAEPLRDRPEVRRRFLSEARVGSQLQHPAIVPVYEVGRSGDGRPLFTMKLVEGRTLAALLRDRAEPGEDLPRLLGVFEQVCQAIAYAHGKGIVHRDLKPANVMVGAFGEVQVMDWGFAKILGDGEKRLNGRPLESAPGRPAEEADKPASTTQSGALMGTPAYMPPEQARGDAASIDYRADVFALGAILCEILTGRPPYAGGAAEDVCRRAAVGDLGDARARLDGSPADAELRDLAKRCLAAEKDARPADAGAVAKAVTAYLASTPDRLRQAQVAQAAAEARASADRRARRLAYGLTAALFAGTAVAGWQAAVAYGAKRDALDAAEAQKEAKVTAQNKEAETRAVLAFFRERVLEAARPKDDEGGLGKDATIRQALDAAEPEIAKAFVGQPVAEADIRHTIGLSYWHLGEFDRALRQNEQALALQQKFLGPEHPETLGTKNNMGLVLYAMGKWDDARKYHEEALRLQRRVLGPVHPDTMTSMHNLANALTYLRRFDEARKLYDETLALQSRVLGPEHRHTLHTMNALAVLLMNQGQLEPSRTLFEETLRLRHKTLGPEHPNTLITRNGLASVLYNLDQKEDARKLYEENLVLERRVLGPDHPDLARTMYNLGNTLATLERNAEAIPYYSEALALQQRVLSPEHFKTLRTMSALSEVLRAEGRLGEARPLSEEALRLRRKVLGPEHPETLISMHGLAQVLYDQGQIAEARDLLEQTAVLRRKVLKPGHKQTLQSENALAWLLATAPDPKFRDPGRAVELAKDVVDRAPEDGEKWSTLGLAHYRAGRWKEAVVALDRSESVTSGDHPAANALFLAMAHWQLGEKDEARRWYGTAGERLAKLKSPDPELARFRTEAAQLLGTN